ncbi:MAG TPA: HEAT repeat domain-containing protein [Polyangiales bacterium]|nr:HEAT repeat domain-containing protein [Polyangiales bacterium]
MTVNAKDAELERVFELARAKRSEAVPKLLALLGEKRWNVRREVVSAIGALGELALPALCDALANDRASETRIAATVDALVVSASAVEGALIALIPQVADKPAVVADIAQILGRRRNPHSVPTLIELLHHSDDNVAVAAIEALGRVGGRAAVDALVETVERDYFFRTYPAIDVLGRSGDPRAVAPLARLLGKSQYLQEAARALGRSADKNAVQPLCELLSTASSPGESNVRVVANALADLIERHEELYGNSSLIFEAIRTSGSDAAVRRLVHALAGAELVERLGICRVLGALQNEAAAPELQRLLDGEPRVAAAAAEALKQLDRGSGEQLRNALHQGDSARRQILLPLLASSASAAEVVRCLDDEDPGVRALACDALARIGERSVVPRLFEQLRESNPRVVQAAISAIQSLGSNQTENLAIQAARSTSASERRAGMRILSYFGYVGAIDVFAQAVHDPDLRVRDVAIAGLAFIEHPRAQALLLAAATAPEEKERAAAMRGLGQSPTSAVVIEALRRGLTDANAWVRYYACQALGKLADEASAGALALLLDDPAGQVRVAAVEALSHLKGAAALDALRAISATDEPDMRRAALIGLGLRKSTESLPVLIAAAAAEEAATRLVALSALSALRSPEALPVLAAALSDTDEGVRAAAIGLLASWPGAEATRLLIAALSQTNLRLQILQVLAGTPVPGRIEGLLNALSTADDELAPSITSVLGRVDSHDSTGALFTALQLPNAAARKAAAALLAARGTREAIAALTRQATEDPSDEVRRVCALLLVR